jgi:hypothetical protein
MLLRFTCLPPLSLPLHDANCGGRREMQTIKTQSLHRPLYLPAHPIGATATEATLQAASAPRLAFACLMWSMLVPRDLLPCGPALCVSLLAYPPNTPPPPGPLHKQSDKGQALRQWSNSYRRAVSHQDLA